MDTESSWQRKLWSSSSESGTCRLQFLLPHIGHISRWPVQSLHSATASNPVVAAADLEPLSSPLPRKPAPTSSSSASSTSCQPKNTELEDFVYVSRNKQSQLLLIRQAPSAIPNVPHPDRLKFREFLGHVAEFESRPHHQGEYQKDLGWGQSRYTPL